MTTPIGFMKWPLVFLAMFSAGGVSPGQSLYDVVISLSDRQRVINQQAQVFTYLTNQNNAPADTDVDLPTDVPIDWLGAGTSPTQSAVDGLDIGGKIGLLNQAAVEFDRLKFAFLNSSPGEFKAGEIVGVLKTHTAGDFEPLPRATPENYAELVRSLAQRVRVLRLITWPAAFYQKEVTDQTDVDEVVVYDDPQDSDHNGNRQPRVEIHDPNGEVVESVNWKPDSIGPGNLKVTSFDPVIQVGYGGGSRVFVSGSYSEDPSGEEAIPAPLRTQILRFSSSYPEEVRVRATAPSGAELQIDGTVYVLRRSHWHEFDVSSVSSRYEKNEAGYGVEGSSAGGAISLFGTTPTATFKGAWITSSDVTGGWSHQLEQTFVEKGYQHKAASVEPSGDGGSYGNSYERNWNIGCNFYSVFMPTFTRGVDDPAMRTKLESADGILADHAADGNLLLHPRPSLWFGIDLGPGLKGGGNGYVSTSSIEIGWHGYNGYYGWFGDDWNSKMRFDSSYSLQFAGSCSDYHVVYENDRSDRTQSLPADSMGWSYTDPSGNVRYDTFTLYHAWDRPRLKQVAGRDLVADITYNANPYGGYTVEIYRRPTGGATPTPGDALAISGMTLIRTWTFSHEGGSTPHPTNAEKLEAVGTGGEKYEIQANEVLPNQGLGWADWHNHPLDWWWWTEGKHSWTLKLSQGTAEKLKKEIEITVSTAENDSAVRDIALREFVDGQPVSSVSSKSLNPFNDAYPADWTITAAEKTITGTATLGTDTDRATRYGTLPTSASIQYDGIQPDATYQWDDKGLLTSFVQGPQSVSGSVDGDAFKMTQQFNGSTVTTHWIELLDGGKKVKTYAAADGVVGSKSSSSVAWSEVEYGTATTGLPGLPGLPHIVRNSDGTGTTYSWNANSSGAYMLTLEKGLLSGSSVSHGTKLIRDVNARGHPNKVEFFITQGSSSLKTGGKVYSDFTAWGMPKKSTDDMTSLDSTWNYSSSLSRLSTHTGSLGVVANFSGYDVLGRPDTVSRNSITASNIHYTAFSTGGVTGNLAETRDNLGRLTSSNTTWNGVTDDLTITPGSSTGITRQHTLLGTHTATLRRDDGTLAASAGPTQPFGGTAGTDLTVDNGLLKSTSNLGDQAATYQTTWTDAWGRIRKTTTAKGTTEFLHTDASSSLQRVRTTEPNGRKIITESDPYNSNGAITRSGIDIDGNGALGASDRYVESLTTLSNGKVITTLKLTEDNRLREILRTEWSPVGNQTLATLNGGEETITRTPNYTNKTVTTTSTKGWSKNETFNNLGLTTSSNLSGAGVPAATLPPAWRADGSLSGVTFATGGDTHSATFNNNGTLATLTAPSKGNILGSHSISGGVETLTVDGVTTVTKLDGTETTTSGSDVPNKTETLATSGNGFKHTTAPTIGAATEVVLNATAAPTAKNYAAGAGESRDYFPGGLLKEITLARGGKLTFGYSNDGAKDLTSATWPQVASGPFTIPGIVQGYGYDRAGRVNFIGDASGARALIYQKGRLKETAWTAGPLAGYKIIRDIDEFGHPSGFQLYRANLPIHSATQAPNGVSGEISNITTSGFNATLGRDPVTRNLTSISRGTVVQNWPRIGGRISSASSNVAGAPSVAYTQFDAQGRRKSCSTAGGAWAYTYTNGQLTNATHPTLGTFTYQFDAIGRRTNMGGANTSDLLNRTLAWTNSQSKTLKVTAHPAAQVWVGIGTAAPVQILNFNGNFSYPIPSPGAQGGWVPWNTLAVLPGQGDPGANPDAKAEQSGATYIPPINESFTYDAAGNRESSALWDYGWDARNNLVRQRTKNYNTAAQGYDITNAYDSQNRRFSKKVNRYQNGTVVEQTVITFLHDGNDLIYERQQLPGGLTILERKYVWGSDISGTQGGAGGAGGLLLIRETKGNTTTDLYPLYDGSGNVTALADNTGTLQAEYAYGPFGELIYARGPYAQSCPFRYATKYYDQETGYYNFGKRFYDPVTGQFLSREPLGEKESLNLYSYCGNDPINYLDVDGLWRINTQEAANDQRVEWLLMQLSAGSGLPNAPRDEWKLYFPESSDFGLYKPYGPDDYKRAQTFVQNLGRPSMRSMTGEQGTAARQPSFGPAPEWIPSTTSALTLGAANTPLNASINSDWLLPTGAGAAGAKFLFGGMKAMLPVLAAGARTEAKLLSLEIRVGEMTSGLGAKAIAVADGSIYSTAFQTTLKSTSFPGVSRASHFQEANGALLKAMEGNSEVATRMQGLGINLERTVTGLAPRQSPAGWTWHHAPEPGVMELVPRTQHRPGSILQPTLHPDGQGGMAIWGN